MECTHICRPGVQGYLSLSVSWSLSLVSLACWQCILLILSYCRCWLVMCLCALLLYKKDKENRARQKETNWEMGVKISFFFLTSVSAHNSTPVVFTFFILHLNHGWQTASFSHEDLLVFSFCVHQTRHFNTTRTNNHETWDNSEFRYILCV